MVLAMELVPDGSVPPFRAAALPFQGDGIDPVGKGSMSPSAGIDGDLPSGQRALRVHVIPPEHGLGAAHEGKAAVVVQGVPELSIGTTTDRVVRPGEWSPYGERRARRGELSARRGRPQERWAHPPEPLAREPPPPVDCARVLQEVGSEAARPRMALGPPPRAADGIGVHGLDGRRAGHRPARSLDLVVVHRLTREKTWNRNL